MKLVILAAGKGKRMGESSNHTPKPILLYKDKTLIHHKLEQLPANISEIIITIGHLGEKIVETIGHSYDNRANGGTVLPITYIEQKDLFGTGHALWQCKNAVGDSPFFVLMGDDLYSKEDLEEMVAKHKDNNESWVALVKDIPEKMSAGKCVIDTDGLLTDIIEDPEGKIEKNTMYTGGCLLTPEIFNLPLVKISDTEYGLPQTFIQEERHMDGIGGKRDIQAVQARYWKRITTPEDLID
jgi:NDP-sugar pyrophosphorylase family protein